MEYRDKKNSDPGNEETDPDMAIRNIGGRALTENGVFLGAGALPPPIGPPPVSLEDMTAWQDESAASITAQEEALRNQIDQNKQGEN